jgi:hypothetical protein
MDLPSFVVGVLEDMKKEGFEPNHEMCLPILMNSIRGNNRQVRKRDNECCTLNLTMMR